MTKRIAALAALLLSGASAVAGAQTLSKSYIVQLRDPPAASYAGGVAGLQATKPPAGQRLEVNASHVRAYLDYVGQKQRAVISAAGNVRVMHRYATVFNGFSAVMTDAQARQLKARGDVASVRLDEARHVSTSYTPVFLGLDKQGGLWPQLGGKGSAGEDMIIGVIDTGIAPDNPAFTDRVDANGRPDPKGTTVAYGPPPARWKGSCETGPGFSAAACNHKVIGARSFRATIDTFIGLGQIIDDPMEFRSVRDSFGHGSHTASTAGGNNGVPATIGGGPIGMTSGMAPRARLAIYKVCWSYTYPGYDGPGENACFTSDTVAAIEQAVQDGVQVLNYSISGAVDSISPTDIAFLGATNAGVFVAAAGGNDGPSNSVDHISPWVTTVAATTHDRTYDGPAQLGNGTTFVGATLNTVPRAAQPLVLGEQAGTATAPVDSARMCFNDGSLDPRKVAGRVVVCDRGTVPLVDKSAAVAAAGGVGMLLLNVAGGPTDTYAIVHSVPTIHLTLDKSAAVKAYAAQAGATAAIGSATANYGKVPAPVVADFSSRGPNLYDGNVLKPDLGAPGVDILASVAPALTQAQHDAVANGAAAPAAYDFYEGTSMATPHVAGVAALLMQQHPDWSPSTIKSALMTTAYPTLPDTLSDPLQKGTTPWGQGAGQIDPTRAADPGLVYRVPTGDWERYLCSTGYDTGQCAALSPIRPSDLNLASLTLASVTGKATLTRSVTNVSTTTSTYTATVALPNFAATVSPSVLTLAPGETKSYTVSLTQTSFADGYAYGNLTWTDGRHVVHSPLTVNAKLLVAPPALRSEAATGSKVYTVGTGFNGRLDMTASLKASTVTTGTIRSIYRGGLCDPSDPDTSYFVKTLVQVPAGALALKAALFADDYPVTADLGITAHGPDYIVQQSSFHDNTNDEAVVFRNPPPGTYDICVLAYAVPPGGVPVKLNTWVVMPGDGAAGDLKALGAGTAHVGGTSTVGLSWHGLAQGTRYFGQVGYLFGGTSLGYSDLDIDASNPLAAPPAAKPKVVGTPPASRGRSGSTSQRGPAALR